jgi:hypothetical protein
VGAGGGACLIGGGVERDLKTYEARFLHAITRINLLHETKTALDTSDAPSKSDGPSASGFA